MTTVTSAHPSAPLAEGPAYKLAFWAFLVNEAFLFGSILASGIFLRVGGTVPWPRPGEAVALGPVLVATLILMASSATFNESLDALRRGNDTFAGKWLGWTLLAGAAFLGIQMYEWWDISRTAAELSGSAAGVLLSNPWGAATYMQVFLLATSLHGLHVLAGLCLIAWLLRSGRFHDQRPVEIVALYWHFVDFVWIFILSTLYFL